MANLKNPIRTCVICRQKFGKEKLLRLQCLNKKLVLFSGLGRSFYICKECQDKTLEDKEVKKTEKALFRECKNKDNYIVQLKEILTYVR